MKISDISREDGIMAASLAQTLSVADKLLDALKLAGLPVTGPGLDRRVEAARWLHALCTEMARQLQPTPPAPETTTMRVKGMGSLPASAPKKPAKVRR